ncbi:carbohydrate ABC transporter permease [Paenibacillus oleatilyticus]|uniref:Carbohydrate ABC transporter permease n=1 Tax=Paenibacillus oleatilyticus TaxID=2594886 RepID=A0ABV4UY95_9BACL|nr:sugar ABC transporter permease [Paenibacillus oleatilyticus]MBU7320890.1 sugar ABC transporter permease [Paenibacillus oleatilyticus]
MESVRNSHIDQHSRLSGRIAQSWKKNAIIYVFLVPVLLHFLVFQFAPLVFSFVLTFMDWPMIGEPSFAGLGNWERFLQDKLAWRSIWNTVLFSVYYIVPTMALGLVLALLVYSKVKLAGLFKGMFFLPVVTSFVILSGIWAWLFKGTDYGVVNHLLSYAGIEPQLFFSDSKQALPVLAALSIFKVCGSTMVYYYAGLQSIPGHLYEAAKMDGATGWRTFWSVTFPLLLPIHFYVAIITTIGSFQIFDSAFLLTGGGPDYSTTTIVYYLYQEGFTSLRFGYGSVLAYVLFFIIFTISLVQRKFLGKDVSYH